MAVGNDEGLKLDGTDDEERLKTSMKRLKEGRGKEGFRVLFRERGILLFFHAGKMTTYRVKIPRFRCGYFRLVCVCVCVCAVT